MVTLPGDRKRLLLLEQGLAEFGNQFAFMVVPYMLVEAFIVDAAVYSMITILVSVASVAGGILASGMSRVLGARCISVAGLVFSGIALGTIVVSAELGFASLNLTVGCYMLVAALSSTYSIGAVVAVKYVVDRPSEYSELNGRRSLVRSASTVVAPSVIGVMLISVSASVLLGVSMVCCFISAAIFWRLLAADQVDGDWRRPLKKTFAQSGPEQAVICRRGALWILTSRYDIAAGAAAPIAATFLRRFSMTLLPIFILRSTGSSSVDFGIVYSFGGIGYVFGGLACSYMQAFLAVKKRQLKLFAVLSGGCCASLGAMHMAEGLHTAGACLFVAISATGGIMIDVLTTTHRQRTLSTQNLASLTAMIDSSETVAGLAAAAAAGAAASAMSVSYVFLGAAVLYGMTAVIIVFVIVLLEYRRRQAPSV